MARMSNVETRRDENTFLGSGCNIMLMFKNIRIHIFYAIR